MARDAFTYATRLAARATYRHTRCIRDVGHADHLQRQPPSDFCYPFAWSGGRHGQVVVQLAARLRLGRPVAPGIKLTACHPILDFAVYDFKI